MSRSPIPTASRAADTTRDVLAVVPCDDGGELRLTLDAVKGWPVVDVRHYERFSMAGAMTGTKRGIAVPLDRLPALISALEGAAAEIAKRGDA
jgi:hypothetical protein